MDMRTTPVTAAAALALTGLLLSGCATADSDAPASEAEPLVGPSLAGFDPCSALSQSDLQHVGVTQPGEQVDENGEIGCDFRGDDEFLLRISKAETTDLASWERQRGVFSSFEPNAVGAREGISAVPAGAPEFSWCRQIIAVGDGSVSVEIKYNADTGRADPETCAKALDIAQVLEPALP
ncbi:Protein of unknown function [Saccharopolyspora antimicrobica]|uniref:Uncharacterized protein DUF3558 n=2 Tax=Saccharopolyspora antimicrobica TaxID=455193 RepID=A0A1I5IN76_9PSEU|nr:uncharacterized protein DUF3558 [Saccharopolyspora antimicrobica]SFO61740.1 Protein of unknown function [Saccharopolyspora antimicrobica]